MIRLIALFFATLLLQACATLDGVGARLAASDISIVEAAIFVRQVAGVDLDLSSFEDRVIVYRAVDTVAGLRRGEIGEADARAEIERLIAEARQ